MNNPYQNSYWKRNGALRVQRGFDGAAELGPVPFEWEEGKQTPQQKEWEEEHGPFEPEWSGNCAEDSATLEAQGWIAVRNEDAYEIADKNYGPHCEPDQDEYIPEVTIRLLTPNGVLEHLRVRERDLASIASKIHKYCCLAQVFSLGEIKRAVRKAAKEGEVNISGSFEVGNGRLQYKIIAEVHC